MTQSPPSDVSDTDVLISRSFAAGRALVFRFWLEPDRLSEWFGPVGYSVPVDSAVVEPRTSGRWDFAMVDDATGDRFPVRGIITELVESELLVVTLSADTGIGHLEGITMRVHFVDDPDAGTRITLRQGPFSTEARDQTASGWEMSFTKLDAVFAAQTAPPAMS